VNLRIRYSVVGQVAVFVRGVPRWVVRVEGVVGVDGVVVVWVDVRWATG
jgi:hypothetical protein